MVHHIKSALNYPHGKITHKAVRVESVSQSANLKAEQEIRQAYTASWQGVILLYVQLRLLAQVKIKLKLRI